MRPSSRVQNVKLSQSHEEVRLETLFQSLQKVPASLVSVEGVRTQDGVKAVVAILSPYCHVAY
jgi:hypothetical protein